MIPDDKIQIETYFPLPQQSEFHRCPVRNKLYGGSMGGGKTRCLCEDINSLMIEYPGNRGLILRKILSDFRMTTYLCLVEKTLNDFIEQGIVKENKAEKYFQYWNKSRLYYGGLEREAADSASERRKYFSGEYGVIAIDEAREVTEREFEELSTRLRHRLPNKKYPPYYMLLGSNPSQNWLKTRFIRNIDKKNFAFFPALPRDNTHNPPDYEQQLKQMFSGDEKFLKAYVEGSWDAVGDIDDLLVMSDIEPVIDRNTVQFSPFAKRLTVYDAARFGDDKTVIQDFMGARIKDQEIYGKKDLMETVGRLMFHQQKNKSRLVGGDVIGEGAGINDRLREIVDEMTYTFSIHDVDFRQQSSRPDQYFNLRAEIYWEARRMILDQNCFVLDDPRLHGQLCSIKYKFVGGGKLGTRIKIEDKDDIKKRLGFSPDEADTFVMGLWLLQFTPVDKQKSWRDKYKQDMAGAGSYMAA